MPIQLFSRKQSTKLPEALIAHILSFCPISFLYMLYRAVGSLALSDAVLAKKLGILSCTEILCLIRLVEGNQKDLFKCIGREGEQKSLFVGLFKGLRVQYDRIVEERKVMKGKDIEESLIVLKAMRKFLYGNVYGKNQQYEQIIDEIIQHHIDSMLLLFEEAYDKMEISVMKRVVKVMQILGACSLCVQLFMDKNPIFFDPDYNPTYLFRSLSCLSCRSLPEVLSADTNHILSTKLLKFMTFIFRLCKQQLYIISEVFDSSFLASKFIQTVFKDVLKEFLDIFNEKAVSKDPLLYLRTMVHAYANCQSLISTLCKEDGESLMGNSLLFLEETFGAFLGSYIAQEEFYLNSVYLCQSKVIHGKLEDCKFIAEGTTDPISNVDSAKASAMSQLSAILSTDLPIFIVSRETMKTSAPKSKMLEKALSNNQDYKDDLYLLDISLDFIQINMESIERSSLVFSNNPEKRMTAVDSIFCVFIDCISKEYGTSFIRQYKQIDSLNDFESPLHFAKFEKAFSYYVSMINVCDAGQELIHAYFTDRIAPKILKTVLQSAAEQSKKTIERFIDDQISCGIEKFIQISMAHAEWILWLEEAEYDIGKLDVEVKCTKACQKVLACLTTYLDMFTRLLDKNFMGIVSDEIGNRFFTLLCKYVKAQQISQTGGFKLMQDFNEFYQWIYEDLKAKESIRILFQSLKELANIYIVPQKDLSSLIHDDLRFKGIFRVEDLWDFLKARNDYKKISKMAEFEKCSIC